MPVISALESWRQEEQKPMIMFGWLSSRFEALLDYRRLNMVCCRPLIPALTKQRHRRGVGVGSLLSFQPVKATE